MKLPADIPIYGDTKYRGSCPSEALEQLTFFSRIRKLHPTTVGALAIHPRNEGERDFAEAARERAEGMTKGAADIVIPGAPAFVCELKRRNHTKSEILPEQLAYLRAARDAGCWVCVALGADAAMEALDDYLAGRQKAIF